jgi:hypothetical protein
MFLLHITISLRDNGSIGCKKAQFFVVQQGLTVFEIFSQVSLCQFFFVCLKEEEEALAQGKRTAIVNFTNILCAAFFV